MRCFLQEKEMHRENLKKHNYFSKWHISKEGREWHKQHAKNCNFGHKKYGIAKCELCGKEFETTKNAYFCCKEHYYAYLKENHIYTANTSKCPNKDTLIQDFVELKNFTQVAKKYDVSDKTITKWCKKLGLPTHINGIKEMINNYKN